MRLSAAVLPRMLPVFRHWPGSPARAKSRLKNSHDAGKSPSAATVILFQKMIFPGALVSLINATKAASAASADIPPAKHQWMADRGFFVSTATPSTAQKAALANARIDARGIV